MSVQLVCDVCERLADDPPGEYGRGMVEIRGVTATRTGEVHRADYPYTQAHWCCVAAFVERANAQDQETPF